MPFASCSSSPVLCVVFSDLSASITSLRAQHRSPLHQFAAPLANRATYNSNHKKNQTISINCLNVCSLSVKSSFFSMFLDERWWEDMSFAMMFFYLAFPCRDFLPIQPTYNLFMRVLVNWQLLGNVLCALI